MNDLTYKQEDYILESSLEKWRDSKQQNKHEYKCVLCGKPSFSRISPDKCQLFTATMDMKIRRIRKGHEITCPHCGSMYVTPINKYPEITMRRRIIGSVHKLVDISKLDADGLRINKTLETTKCEICGKTTYKWNTRRDKVLGNNKRGCIQCIQMAHIMKRHNNISRIVQQMKKKKEKGDIKNGNE